MSTTALALAGADLTALAVLVLALYLPRHGRKDLMAAYIGVNIGVLAVTTLLAGTTVSAGLGLGLFGVLSIIRLRSTELSQHEVAYYFTALALGLVGGIPTSSLTLSLALMALLVTAMAVADAPGLFSRNRHQLVMVDHALTDESQLTDHLERLLGGQVRSLEVQRLDLVNDTTLVDVRYRLHRPAHQAETGTRSLTSAPSLQTPDAAPEATTEALRPPYLVPSWSPNTLEPSTKQAQREPQRTTAAPAAAR